METGKQGDNRISKEKERRDCCEQKRHFFKVTLLIVGMVMLCAGVMRGEADTVLSKAIRLCLECVGIG